MNSSFPNRWSFSYLKFTKYVTNNRWSFSYLKFTKYVTNKILLLSRCGHGLLANWQSARPPKHPIRRHLRSNQVCHRPIQLGGARGRLCNAHDRIRFRDALTDTSVPMDELKYGDLIKEKLINLIEWTFKREGSSYIACNERQAFFTSEDTKRYKLWSCQNVCEALIYLLDNIYIRFGTKLYRQIVGIPMGTNCAPLVADMFLFCYERDFMTSLSDVKEADIIEAFKSTSRYLEDLLNMDNPYFEGMVNRIYPPELQLNKANTSDTKAPFLDLHISI